MNVQLVAAEKLNQCNQVSTDKGLQTGVYIVIIDVVVCLGVVNNIRCNLIATN